MLNYLLKLIPNASARQIVNWNRFVTILKLRTEVLRSRFLIAPFIYTSGNNMIIRMLNSIPIKELESLSNDYQRYTQIIYPMVTQHRMMFDQVYSGKLKTSYFTKNPNVTEIILNVSMNNPLSTMPMDWDWYRWQEQKPIRVIHYDSLELITDLTAFRLEFNKSNPPSRCVYSIDTSLLFLKYWKYVSHNQNIGESYSVEEFIQQYIFNTWFEDIRNIWLFNIVAKMLFEEFDASEITTDPLIQISSMIPSLKKDLNSIVALCNKKTIGIGDIVATDWLDNTSIYNWMKEMTDATQVPDLRQYKSLDIIRTIPFIQFVIKLLHKVGRPDVVLVNRDLMYAVRRCRDMNVTAILHDPKLREVVKQELDDLYAQLSKYAQSPSIYSTT